MSLLPSELYSALEHMVARGEPDDDALPIGRDDDPRDVVRPAPPDPGAP